MKLHKAMEKLVLKQTKYIQSSSLYMYDQTLSSIRKWLFEDNGRYFKEMTEAKDWQIQNRILGK